MNFKKTFKEYLYLKQHHNKINIQLFSVFFISVTCFLLSIFNSLHHDFFGLCLILLSFIGIAYVITKEFYRTHIEERLKNMIYIGDLNEIFDLNSDSDNEILSRNASIIQEDFIENEGLSGKLILQLYNDINALKSIKYKEELLIDKIEKNQNLKLMIEQIENINSRKLDEEQI